METHCLLAGPRPASANAPAQPSADRPTRVPQHLLPHVLDGLARRVQLLGGAVPLQQRAVLPPGGGQELGYHALADLGAPRGGGCVRSKLRSLLAARGHG